MLSPIAIKNYLQSYRRATLQELSRIFKEDQAIILDLLQYFIRKNYISAKYLDLDINLDLNNKNCTACAGCTCNTKKNILNNKNSIVIEWLRS